MIVPRLRSEARGGSSTGTSTRYSGGVYGAKVHQGQHNNDPDLKRALQYSYTSQAVRKWEKRWVIIHETPMRVHKWMPAPAAAPTLASQIVADKTAALANNNENENNNIDQQQEDSQAPQEQQQQQQESTSGTTQDTQMMVDDESTSQSSQA
jgi:hypothetical protein